MNDKMQALRKDYMTFMEQSRKAKSTAYATANKLFSLWKDCGEEFFWSVIRAEENEMKEVVTNYLLKHYPKRVKYKSGYITSIHCFCKFIATKGEKINSPAISQTKPRKTSPVRKHSGMVLTLTGEMLEREHQIVLTDPGYGKDYALIHSALNRFPLNNDPELVALKIALIDMTNSTNIGRHRKKIVVSELADVIVGVRDFDERLRQGDPSLVPIIAKNNGSINLFSFASKYCTYHAVDVYGRDDYVIFDSVVKDALPKYVDGLRKTTIDRWRQEYNYLAYRQCIDELLDANEIHIPFRHRKLDHYLWHTYRKAEKETAEDE